MSKRLRVGIIGVSAARGWGSEAHLPALRGLDEYEVVALATTRQETADEAARAFDVPLAFGDATELARHPEVDVVSVIVRTPAHDRLVRAALDAGKHVFCEWPLGVSTEQATALAVLADHAGVRHIVGLQGYHAPHTRRVAGLISDGVIGEVRTVSIVASSGTHGARVSQAMAYSVDVAAGTSILTTQSSHVFATLATTVGPLASVSAMLPTISPEVEVAETGERLPVTVPDQIGVVGMLESGALLSFTVQSGVAPAVHGFHFRIVGSEGTLVVTPAPPEPGEDRRRPPGFQRSDWHVVVAKPDGSMTELSIRHDDGTLPDTVPAGPPRSAAYLYRELSEAIAQDRPAVPDFHTAVRFHQLVDAVTRAAATGMRQDLGSGPD